jgi:CRP-like cAMP-binding protein
MKELTRFYPQGAVIFEENDPGSRMYVVKLGRVKISRRLAGSEVVLANIPPGEFFGEMALLEDLPRSATATVLEDSELIEIDKQTFEQMIRHSSEIAVRMMRKLAERLRATDRRLQGALIENGVGRVLEGLRTLASRGEPCADGEWVRVPANDPGYDVYPHAGIPLAQRREVERRLIDAKVVRRYQGDFFVAEEKRLAAYGDFLQLHQIYDPLITRELGDAQLEEDGVERLVRRMLIEKMATEDGIVADPASDRVVREYERYLTLKARFGAPR